MSQTSARLTKWCTHCLKNDHADEECWSTRVYDPRPPVVMPPLKLHQQKVMEWLRKMPAKLNCDLPNGLGEGFLGDFKKPEK